MDENGSVQLKDELVSKLEERAAESNFDSVDGYIEFILEEVVHQLGEPVATVDEDNVKDRLESLGYVE